MNKLFAGVGLAMFVIVMALMLPSCSQAADDTPCEQWCKPFWKSMPKEEYVYLAVSSLDMLTTLDIKNHPKVYETNLFLGKHPSDAKIIGWFAATDLLHAGITYILIDDDAPKFIVKTWEYITIGMETGYAIHNFNLGLRIRF